MKFDLPVEVIDISKKIEKAGYEIYLVGGAVRDMLMGRDTYDWDFTTNATPEEIIELFLDSFYDNAFGTVGIPNKEKGERPYEITTYRTEHGYSDSRRPDVVKWGKELSEDLERRDFTINAMALKIHHDKIVKTLDQNSKFMTCEMEIIDPFGGKEDLQNKIIKAVGNANERFSEDALREMRAVRIASELNFTIEKNTTEAIKKYAHLTHNLAPERIRDELFKLIASPHAANGVMQMKEVGLMKEILPELENTFGVGQKSPNRHHIYDVGTHCVMSLKYCNSRDPIVRFATLIHDIGKTQTRHVLDTGVVTFYNHEVAGGKIAKQIANRLRFSNKEKDKFYILVRYHQFTVDERQTDTALRRFIKKVTKEYIPDMLDLRVADRLGGGARETSWRLEEFKSRLIQVQKQPFSVHDLKISGTDIINNLGMKPGPEIGNLLDHLFADVVAKVTPNEKDALLDRLTVISQNNENN